MELIEQLLTGIQAGVGRDPGVSIHGARLGTLRRPGIGDQQSVAEPDIALNPGSLRIRSPRGQKSGQAAQQYRVDRRAVKIQNANDAAHSDFPSSL